MGRLASHTRHTGRRAAHRGDALTRALPSSPDTRRTRGTARALAALLCLLACASAFISPSHAFKTSAQSGRHRPTQPGQPAKPRETPRPRPVTTTPPAPTPTPADAQTASGPTAPSSTSSPQTDAQKGAPEEAGDDEVVRINSNLVPVPAFVTDAPGRAVADLQLKDFELLVDGQPRAVAELTRADTPITLVMLFDNSSSLRPEASRRFEKEAAAGFFKTVMRPVDRAAIVSLSSYPELSQPLTSDVRALVGTIEGFEKPEGATALFDSVVYAADYLRLQRGRKVLVLVSDGTDTNSTLEFDETLARVLALNCQIYAVRTGHSEHPNLRDLAGERRLQEFAAQTGGAVYVPRNRDELRQAFAQIAADLAQQYVLSYYPSEDPPDGRFRKFTLRVGTRPDLQVRTRKGYYSPKK